MKSAKAWTLGVTCLILMAGSVVLLQRFQSVHHLGQPGVKLVEVALPDDKEGIAATNSIYLPERVLDYTSSLQPVTRVELEWLPPDTTFGRRQYKAGDGFQVFVSAVLMGSDRTSIHKPEYCLPSQGFRITRRSQNEIPIQSPHSYLLPVTRLDALKEVRLPGGRTQEMGAVYVYWFLSDTRLSNDHLERMWWLAMDLVRTGELQRWSYIGCLAACAPGQEDGAYRRIQSFIQEMVPQFQLTTGPLTVAESHSPALVAERSIPGLHPPASRER